MRKTFIMHLTRARCTKNADIERLSSFGHNYTWKINDYHNCKSPAHSALKVTQRHWRLYFNCEKLSRYKILNIPIPFYSSFFSYLIYSFTLPTLNMSNTTVYSLDDVSKHNTKNDLYMAIHNKVYNITDFVLEVSKKKKRNSWGIVAH